MKSESAIRYESLPWGRLSNIGMSLDWRFFTVDVITAGSIFSQIFEIGGYPCKAELTFTKETGNVAFCVKPLVGLEHIGGMKVLVKARACTIERGITVGNQITQANLYTSLSKGGFSNFLTRTILQKYDELLIEIGLQTEFRPDSPLKAFWNCPSTSDIMIVSGNAGEEPVFAHKKFVLEAVPKIRGFITKIGSEADFAAVPGTFEQSLASNMHDGSADSKPISKPYSLNNATEKCERTPGEAIAVATAQGETDSRSESLRDDKKQPTAAYQDTIAGNVNSKRPRHDSDTDETSHSAVKKDEKIAKNVDTAKNRAEEGIQAILPVSIVGSNHEVWLWSPSLPRNSCIDVMRWIYLRRLSPEFNLEAFNPFMTLLADLDEWHHFQEHAMRAQGYIFLQADLQLLLREPSFQQGYARKYLKGTLLAAVKLNHEKMLRKHYQELQENDRTGAVQEFLKNNKILEL
ncbi:hypothetical protein BGX26_003033 [Mortierella sp. AD094]|nr:hypothetical protein BGX26_003033 [Mortierella sp. AD094]